MKHLMPCLMSMMLLNGCYKSAGSKEVDPDAGDPGKDTNTSADADSDSDMDVDTDTDVDADTDVDTGMGSDRDAGIPSATSCVGTNVWYDSESNLCWQNPQGGSAIEFPDAVTYCDSLVLNGYDDWYLPSIDDLRTLIRGCPDTELKGACPVTDSEVLDALNEACNGCYYGDGPGTDGNYLDPAVYALTYNFDRWSSSEIGGSSWGINFRTSEIILWPKQYDASVVCVRSGDYLNHQSDGYPDMDLEACIDSVFSIMEPYFEESQQNINTDCSHNPKLCLDVADLAREDLIVRGIKICKTALTCIDTIYSIVPPSVCWNQFYVGHSSSCVGSGLGTAYCRWTGETSFACECDGVRSNDEFQPTCQGNAGANDFGLENCDCQKNCFNCC